MNNRIYKFRVWDKTSKIMLEVAILDLKNNSVSYNKMVGEPNKDMHNASSFELVELMQFTGLKDCHGKEIYEGDICKYYQSMGGEKIMPIEWHEEGSWWPRPYKDDYVTLEAFEVVGNIWETPELLESRGTYEKQTNQ